MASLQDLTSKWGIPLVAIPAIVLVGWWAQGARVEIVSAHAELRHEVEKMRMEVTRDIRDLTRAVDLGVSTAQAEAWIELFRARLQSVEPKLVPAIPDLPKRK